MQLRQNRQLPGRYREEEMSTLSPRHSSPVFTHRKIPYNPNLREACFPTIGLDEWPPSYYTAAKSSKKTEEEEQGDNAEAAKFELGMSQIMLSPIPASIEAEKSAYLSQSYSSQNSSGRIYLETLAAHDFASSETRSFNLRAEWSDLSDGMKLTIMKELTQDISFELAVRYLGLEEQLINDLINLNKREIKLNKEEDARIAAVNKRQLAILMKGDFITNHEEYAATMDELDELECRATMFITKNDIKKGVSFLSNLRCFKGPEQRRYQFPPERNGIPNLSPARLIGELINHLWSYEGVEICRNNTILHPKRRVPAASVQDGRNARNSIQKPSPQPANMVQESITVSHPLNNNVSGKTPKRKNIGDDAQKLALQSPRELPAAPPISPSPATTTETVSNPLTEQKRRRIVLTNTHEGSSSRSPLPKGRPKKQPVGPSRLRNSFTVDDLQPRVSAAPRSTPGSGNSLPPVDSRASNVLQVPSNLKSMSTQAGLPTLVGLGSSQPSSNIRKFPFSGDGTVKETSSRILDSPGSKICNVKEPSMIPLENNTAMPPPQLFARNGSNSSNLRPPPPKSNFLMDILVPVKNLAGKQIGRTRQQHHWTYDPSLEKSIPVNSRGVRQVSKPASQARRYSEFWIEQGKLISSSFSGVDSSSKVPNTDSVPSSFASDGVTRNVQALRQQPSISHVAPVPQSQPIIRSGMQQTDSLGYYNSMAHSKGLGMLKNEQFSPQNGTINQKMGIFGADYAQNLHSSTGFVSRLTGSPQLTPLPKQYLPLRRWNSTSNPRVSPPGHSPLSNYQHQFYSRGRQYLEHPFSMFDPQSASSVALLTPNNAGNGIKYESPYISSGNAFLATPNTEVNGFGGNAKAISEVVAESLRFQEDSSNFPCATGSTPVFRLPPTNKNQSLLTDEDLKPSLRRCIQEEIPHFEEHFDYHIIGSNINRGKIKLNETEKLHKPIPSSTIPHSGHDTEYKTRVVIPAMADQIINNHPTIDSDFPPPKKIMMHKHNNDMPTDEGITSFPNLGNVNDRTFKASQVQHNL
ncbi:hypothetical protein B7463_g712, partial [Scytalidium lignicola]